MTSLKVTTVVNTTEVKRFCFSSRIGAKKSQPPEHEARTRRFHQQAAAFHLLGDDSVEGKLGKMVIMIPAVSDIIA